MNSGLLIKKHSDNNNLRTNQVDGFFSKLPELGKSFFFTSEGIDFGTRFVTTSIVTRINQLSPNEIEFSTLNSTYQLTIHQKM